MSSQPELASAQAPFQQKLIANTPEDTTLIAEQVSPTPTPFSSPTPVPTPFCPATWRATWNGQSVCIPPSCLSDPRYSSFITCDSNNHCTCEDGCKIAPVYQMTITDLAAGGAYWQSPCTNGNCSQLASGDYPRCLTNIATLCGNRWSTEVNLLRQYYQFMRDMYTNWVYVGTAGWTYCPGTWLCKYQTIAPHILSPTQPDPYVYSYGSDECVVEAIGGRNDVGSMSLLLDANCKPLKSSPYQCDLKGNIYHDSGYWVWPTPISLLIDGKTRIGDAVNVVQFPLNLGSSDKWYAWKASSMAPLIVFDPKHEGQIKDATQLFGNHTFGKSWKHGFEALASLDVNFDGRLSESELQDLGLWFDENRDGVSQSGEVRDIRTAGITTLYVIPDQSQEAGKDVYITHGFDRIVDGKVIKGVAVDWFVAEYNSREEGLIKEQARAAQDGNYYPELEQPSGNPDNTAAASSGNDALGANNILSTPDLSGSWVWTTVETTLAGEVVELMKNKTAPAGLLTFKEVDGKLVGHSFVEISKPTNSSGIKSEVVMFALNGTTKAEKLTKIKQVEFTVKQNDLVTRSSAELSEDGRWLLGKSKMQIGRGVDKKPIYVEYLWKAERVGK